jgi:hypothetical protein
MACLGVVASAAGTMPEREAERAGKRSRRSYKSGKSQQQTVTFATFPMTPAELRKHSQQLLVETRQLREQAQEARRSAVARRLEVEHAIETMNAIRDKTKHILDRYPSNPGRLKKGAA